ncbi:MAG: orotate phosphoribosyltransferase [Acidimicrobiia bacterium]|nr:orotate phosphoribosyltransferase [Acidimicrobiia bacterium]
MTRDDLANLIRTKAIRTDGPFTLRSGEVSDWYLDARQVTYAGEGANLIGPLLLPFVEEDVVAVGGMTMGADPIALAIAVEATNQGRRLNSFSIRKEAKDHGTGGRLVGPVTQGDRVTIVEDTTTTGGAIRESIDVARSEGLDVASALVLIDRSDGRALSASEEFAVPYMAVFTPRDLGMEP